MVERLGAPLSTARPRAENVGARRKIGAITIGQSPRADVVPEMLDMLGPGVDLIEGGALDGLSADEIERMAPGAGDDVLVTRLRDGSSVQIAERLILSRMQAEIERLTTAGVEVVALLCTGTFPAFNSARLIVELDKVVQHFVAGVAGGRRLGAVVPAPSQVDQWTRRWERLVGQGAVRVEAGSPYADLVGIEQAVERLAGWGAELIVLDCIGYSAAMKARTAAIAGVPVILPRTVLARALAELL